MKRRARNYLLIEVMLSIALVSLCLIPLIKPLFFQLKKEKAFVVNMQLEHAAQNSFLEIKELLYQANLTNLNIENGLAGTLPPFYYHSSLEKSSTSENALDRTYKLTFLKKLNKKNPPVVFYLFDVEIDIKFREGDKKPFHYSLILEERDL